MLIKESKLRSMIRESLYYRNIARQMENLCHRYNIIANAIGERVSCVKDDDYSITLNRFDNDNNMSFSTFEISESGLKDLQRYFNYLYHYLPKQTRSEYETLTARRKRLKNEFENKRSHAIKTGNILNIDPDHEG